MLPFRYIDRYISSCLHTLKMFPQLVIYYIHVNLDKGHNIFDRKILVIYLVLALMLIDIVALSALKQGLLNQGMR